jgi:peptide/nickel transport system permease protein
METCLQVITNQGLQKRNSQFKLKCVRFSRNKLAMIGLVVLVILMFAVFSAPLYINYNRVEAQKVSDRFQQPNAEHIFGTDQFGRDLFARIIYGGRISLFAGLVTIGIAFIIGLILGCLSGFFGGKVDIVIMRFCDILMAVPSLLLSMALVAALGQGLFKMLIALSIASIPGQARTVRVAVMTLRSQEYVEAARTYGSATYRILVKHIIPNIVGPMVVSVTMNLGSVILQIAALGFLGIGIAPPTPEWGTIISENQTNIRFYPYLGIIPGLFIMISVMCLNFIGDGFRDALDPRMKK